MLEKNTKQVNQIMVRIYAVCAAIILVLVVCSCLGIFEFGKVYTSIVFVAGLIISISPSILIHFVSDDVLKYYMLIMTAVFIGILGTNNNIGVYITYVLVPVFSCLYFDPKLTVKCSILSYIAMVIAVYINTASKFEVVYLGMSRTQLFIACILGFTVEYLVVDSILVYVVKRARQMMEERYSAQEENRMKSRFLSSMSHEIRTPMNAIIGISDVALRKPMEPELRKYLTIIKNSSTGLLEIVNDIIDFSKIEAGRFNIVVDRYSTQELVNDIEAVIDARNVDGAVPVYYHIQEGLPAYLEGDVVRIKQVMLNFATNAIKYTDKGHIDIYLECVDVDNDSVVLKCKVSDTGHGIKKEDMDDLFVMYNQFDAEKHHGKEGAGIGLAVSKSFVELMGGTIEVESTYGVGSTFSFSVPQKVVRDVKEGQTAGIGVVKAKEEETAVIENGKNNDTVYSEAFWFKTRDARVLLADDNDINREVFKAIVEPLGLEIDEAQNGEEAFNMATKDVEYDMIFMDSHMPVMNGEQATHAIRQAEGTVNQHKPIIAITADAITGVRERLLSGGMDDYVVKLINTELICRVIRKYLPAQKVVDL